MHRPLLPDHAVLVSGGPSALTRGVAEAFVEAGAHVAVVGPTSWPGTVLDVGADASEADVYEMAREAVGPVRTLVSLPQGDVTDPAFGGGDLLAEGDCGRRVGDPACRTVGLAACAVDGGAESVVVVAGRPRVGADAVVEAARTAAAGALVEELSASSTRVHAVVVEPPDPAFRPVSPGGTLALDVSAALTPADVGALCVLLSSSVGAAVASETLRLGSRADLLRWMGL